MLKPVDISELSKNFQQLFIFGMYVLVVQIKRNNFVDAACLIDSFIILTKAGELRNCIINTHH